jgi:hypothetical protein
VSGKSYTVPRNRNLTLSLNREFTWNINGKEARGETVADDANIHDIVIRP